MQLTSEDRLKFYKRTALSAGMFVLLFSFGLNVFLFLTRVPPTHIEIPQEPLEDGLLPGALAYGVVERGFPVRTQSVSGTSAVIPVSSYVLPKEMLPELPSALALFRDQGMRADDAHMKRLLEKMRIPLQIQDLGLLPVSEKWRSADRTMDFIFDAEKRSLTVSVLGAFSASDEGRADDIETIAIADRFISQFNIDRSAFRQPYIVEKTSDTGGPSKTYVVWAMSFNGLPLIDSYGQPVPGAQVQVGRLSRKALSATFTLLSADSLTRSAYPRAESDELTKGLLSGGLLPAPKAAKGVKSVATYAGTQQVYILFPADKEHPTYVVPGLYAVWLQPACKDCGLMPVPTFVPTISDENFRWYIPPPKTMKPVAPASASGAVKTGSGMQAGSGKTVK